MASPLEAACGKTAAKLSGGGRAVQEGLGVTLCCALAAAIPAQTKVLPTVGFSWPQRYQQRRVGQVEAAAYLQGAPRTLLWGRGVAGAQGAPPWSV